jgi:hypothetical protein
MLRNADSRLLGCGAVFLTKFRSCEGSQCLYPQGQAVCFVCFDIFTLKVLAVCALQNFGSTIRVTQSHMPEDMNLQLYNCGNFKVSVPENTLFQFIFLLKHKFYLNLTSFYLENKLFCDRIYQHVRLSDSHRDVYTH